MTNDCPHHSARCLSGAHNHLDHCLDCHQVYVFVVQTTGGWRQVGLFR